MLSILKSRSSGWLTFRNTFERSSGSKLLKMFVVLARALFQPNTELAPVGNT